MNYAEMADEALMRRVLSRDKAAFNELVKRHEDWIYNYAFWRYRHRELSEDCCQDILATLWDKASERMVSTMELGGFCPYVRTMVVNHFKSHARKHNWALTDDGTLPDGVSNITPDREFGANRQLNEIRAALDGMPSKRKQIVVLHVICDLSVKVVASMTGSSESAVRSLMHEARKELRNKLGGSY